MVLKVLSEQSAAISLADLEQKFEKVDKVTLYTTLKTIEKKTNSFIVLMMAPGL